MPTNVERLTQGRVKDFWHVLSAGEGCAWCACIAWWTPTWDGFPDRTAEENRALRESLFAKGQHDGYLLYDGDCPVAWCQVGPRDRLVKLARDFALEPDPTIWAVTCFVVPPDERRKGRSRALLSGVIADLPSRGASALEAVPLVADADDPDELWTGPRSLFEAAGFSCVRTYTRRALYRLPLPALPRHG